MIMRAYLIWEHSRWGPFVRVGLHLRPVLAHQLPLSFFTKLASAFPSLKSVITLAIVFGANF